MYKFTAMEVKLNPTVKSPRSRDKVILYGLEEHQDLYCMRPNACEIVFFLMGRRWETIECDHNLLCVSEMTLIFVPFLEVGYVIITRKHGRVTHLLKTCSVSNHGCLPYKCFFQ